MHTEKEMEVINALQGLLLLSFTIIRHIENLFENLMFSVASSGHGLVDDLKFSVAMLPCKTQHILPPPYAWGPLWEGRIDAREK